MNETIIPDTNNISEREKNVGMDRRSKVDMLDHVHSRNVMACCSAAAAIHFGRPSAYNKG